MAWVKDINSLYDFIGYVILRAPDRFPKEDFLTETEQMTLDRAFEVLRYGVTLVESEFPGSNQERALCRLLDQAEESYRLGDIIKGAHILQDFQNCIYSKPVK